jgi:uncharacterized RDD family membrane protein YckC
MNWYYVEAGKQAGPVDDAQLDEFASSGKIQPDTLVWREGMANWEAYNTTRGSAAGSVPAAAASAAPPTQGAVCSECGKLFAIEDTIQYGDVRVCAACKPLFVQRLAEGGQVRSGALNYAGFWTRFGAVFLDGLLLGAVNIAISMVAGLGFGAAVGARPSGQLGLQLVLFVIQMAIGISYEVILIGKYGATLGKKACKIKVVTADGGRVSYARAFGRYFAKLLSTFTCLIGYIMAAFDAEKRALHDRICNTRVVLAS